MNTRTRLTLVGTHPRVPATQTDDTLYTYTLMARIGGELTEHTFVSTHASALDVVMGCAKNPHSDPIVLHNHGPVTE